jgi:hypothetical protein
VDALGLQLSHSAPPQASRIRSPAPVMRED